MAGGTRLLWPRPGSHAHSLGQGTRSAAVLEPGGWRAEPFKEGSTYSKKRWEGMLGKYKQQATSSPPGLGAQVGRVPRIFRDTDTAASCFCSRYFLWLLLPSHCPVSVLALCPRPGKARGSEHMQGHRGDELSGPLVWGPRCHPRGSAGNPHISSPLFYFSEIGCISDSTDSISAPARYLVPSYVSPP